MRGRPSRALEALATGLAYGAALCWVGVCLVASFRPADLSAPYWSGVPCLRSDTSGIVAFLSVAVCFGASEYLRLRRRRDTAATPAPRSPDTNLQLFALATSETVAILATGLVVYWSVNAVTHPATLGIHATHLVSGPTEGTLRVVALLMGICSVTVLRYLLAVPICRGADHGVQSLRRPKAVTATRCDFETDTP
jgi:hypothetical protein